MGKSETINCIGQRVNGLLEYAMTKLEVYQKTLLNPKIEYWYSQTEEGARILGSFNKKLKNCGGRFDISFRDVILDNPPKGIIDCICITSCPLCRGSHKTTKKEMNSYREWQIEEFKKR